MPRRFAVLDCEDLPKWAGYAELLWKQSLDREGDTWQIYECYNRQYPKVEEAANFDCIVITGSHYSAYDPDPWIGELAQLLPQYAATGTKILGCCFGCQLLAVALGGDVGKNPSGRFVLGVETVSATPDLLRHQPQLMSALLKAAQHAAAASQASAPSNPSTPPPVPAPASSSSASTHAAAGTSTPTTAREQPAPSVQLFQAHGDQILQLPPGARLLADSPTAAAELWAHGTNVLAFQFHPELNGGLMHEKIWPTMCANGRLSADEAAASETQLLCGRDDSAPVLEMLQHFIAHGLEEWPPRDGPPGQGGSDRPTLVEAVAVQLQAGSSTATASPSASSNRAAMQPPGATDTTGPSIQAHAISAASTPARSLPDASARSPRTPNSTPSTPPLMPSSQSPPPPPLPLSTPPTQPPSPPPAPSLAELSLTDLPTTPATPTTPPPAASSPPPTLTPAPARLSPPSYFSFPFPTSPFNLYHSSTASASNPTTSRSTPTTPSQPPRTQPAPSPSSSMSPVPPIAGQLPTYYERKQQRQQRLDEAVSRLATNLRGTLHAGLLEGAMGSELLLQLNQVACAKLDEMADVATAMADFAGEAGRKHDAMKANLAQLGELLGPLQKLEQQLDAVDAASRTLARQLGVAEDAA